MDHDLYSDYAGRPSRMEFQILETGDRPVSEMDWDKARVISVDFDAEEMVVRNLTPNTQYSVRARAINEAGESGFCQPTVMETTDPWAPKKPEHVRMDCDEVCTVSWEEPNDHGSEITAYRVTVQEYTENEETGEEEDVGSPFTVEVGGEERSLELTHIRPQSSYRISVSAINAIGVGETEEVEVDTDDAPLSYSESFLTPKLPIIVGLSLFVILIVIDLVCYSTNRCGLIACFCINCLGRAPRDHKEKDVEAGRGENNRLLDNQASSPPAAMMLQTVPLTTTV
ncbi:fibronectin type III domain protein [Oesophagostomum dentatum]|uniref:Fibronectin type III domain protein n=1 Tax=Oesophagostomum dentatum TaxID=61180 RepID=A0A0B1SYA7_OESDE|nr:fibronectin type III domain protein [Oesophagostomum dentatum]